MVQGRDQLTGQMIYWWYDRLLALYYQRSINGFRSLWDEIITMFDLQILHNI